MSATEKSSQYKGTFVQADANGDYVNLGRSYKVKIEGDFLEFSDTRIPLIKVKGAARVGCGASLDFLDTRNIANRAMVTTGNFFGIAIGRSKRLDEFVENVNKAALLARESAATDTVAAAQKVAPPDTCHDCGAQGGAPLVFGKVYGVISITRWSTTPGVYCKTHATRRGVRSLLETGLLGWWSVVGTLKHLPSFR